MTGRRWIALVVLLALGVGLLVTVVVVPWGDDAPASNNPGVYHEGEEVTVAEGDEFVVALPASGEREATEVADTIARHVHAAAPVLAGVAHPSGTLSISVGIAGRTFEKLPASTPASADQAGEQLFRDADAALYVAKNGGRNRISVAATHALTAIR